ncbi:D-hexose-6-phosphate mutarotase [Bifidobacterium aerophilum]|uniref:Putative glucose-6-phosphate 1-epimerase n=1 Tax=Bifidobacterium aerophilum TaxID=1798155 RepID=A0A6N9Z2Q9_9BIFI|nr:D-hexose-6-phosphate mutarotase [Bifidobacterium aerophilum]NEG88868.1 D-hexose-6-phosphate mutarotase [Bifidobacterium aerophilum]
MSSTFVIRNIVNEDGSALIGDHGAHVINWAPTGQPTVVWQPKAVYLGPNAAVRGGVPVIFPWFNAGFAHGEPTDKKPKHGFARLSFWKADEATLTDRHIRYTLDSDDIDPALVDQLISGPGSRFHAEYDVTVGDTLTMTLTVTNTGDQPLEYETALHTYFHVSDVTTIGVEGLGGATYLDATQPGFPRRAQDDPTVTFDGTTVDRIYYSDDELRVRDEGLGRTIVIGKSGSPQTVVWNPGEVAGNAIGDLAEAEWRDFVCVEAAANRELAVVLAPGESHALSQTVRVE